MFKVLSKLLRDDSGASAIEYSLFAALLSATAIAAIAG